MFFCPMIKDMQALLQIRYFQIDYHIENEIILWTIGKPLKQERMIMEILIFNFDIN